MKKLEKILLLTFSVIFIINIWIDDNEVTQPLFGFTLIIFSIIYLFFGYFIFKNNTTLVNSKFLPILNGIFVSICILTLMGKLIEPTFSKYIIITTVPLFLITTYYGYRSLKETNIEEVQYLKKAFRKNTIYFVSFVVIMISPAKIFATIIYGYNSSMYNQTLQILYLKEAKSFRQNDEIEKAIICIKKSLEYSEIRNDRSSDLYQNCLNEFGSIYYKDGKYREADSVLNLVISIYNFEDYNKIIQVYNENYQEQYFYAIYTKAQINSSWGGYYTSDSLYQIALNYYTDDIVLAYIYSDLGYVNSMRGKFKIADSILNLSIKYHQKTDIEDKNNYLLTLLEIAENHIKTSNFNSADSVLKQSYSFARTEFGLKNIEVANVLDVFVTLYIKMANYDEAEKFCLESIIIKESEIGKTHSDYLDSKIDLASIYISKSEYKEAEVLLKEMETIIQRDYHPKSSIAIKLFDVLSQYYEDFMNYNEAQLYAEKSLEGRIYKYGNYNIKTAISYHNLASTFYYQQKYSDADSLFNLSLKIRKYYSGMESPEYLSSLNGLSLILIERDSLSIAEKYLNYCLLTYEEKFCIEQPDYAIILSNIAELDIKNNLFPNAEEKLLAALQILKNVFPENHIKIAKTYYNLGVLQSKKGNIKEAVNYLVKSVTIYQSLLGNSHYFVNHIRIEIKKLQAKSLRVTLGKLKQPLVKLK